jgi:hypothetical protein
MPIQYFCGITMNQNSIVTPVIDPVNTAPSVGTEVEGQQYYDTSTNLMYFWNGTSWVTMDGSGSGVSTLAIGNSAVNAAGVNAGLTLSGATGAVTLTPKIYGGGANVGFVPTGGAAGTFLRGDGVFATPAGGGTMSSWKLAANTGTTFDIVDGAIASFAATAGSGINTAVSNPTGTTGLVGIEMDINNLTTAVAVKTDFLAFSDESATGDPTRKVAIEDVLALGGFLAGVVAGDGLIETNGATTNPTISVDYAGADNIILSAAAAVTPVGADTIMINDDTDGDVKQALISNLPFDSYDSWNLAGSAGTPQVISSGNTATFLGYAQDDALAGIATVASATDSLKIGLDQSKILAVTTAGDTDYILISDVTTDANERVPVRNLTLDQWGNAAGNVSMGTSHKIVAMADPTAAQDAATKAYVDSLVVGGLTFRGTFNASTGQILSGTYFVAGAGNEVYLYQVNTGVFQPSAARIAIDTGDYYIAQVAGNFYGSSGTGTCSTVQGLDIGDSIIAVDDAAANSSVCSDWSIVQSDEGVASFTNAFGTFITGTNNLGASGAVTLGTIDLVNNTPLNAPTSANFYRGDGNWVTPSTNDQTISGSGSDNTDSGVTLSDSGGTVLILGAGNITAAQTGNTITLTGTDAVSSVDVSASQNGLAISPTTGNVKVNIDINNMVDGNAAVIASDFLMFNDVSESKNLRCRVSDILALAPQGDITSVVASALPAALGISVTSSTGPIPVVGLDITGLSTGAPASGDFIAMYDISGTPENKKVTVASLAPIIRKASTYVETITSFQEVDHNLGSYDVMVQLYNATTYETVEACVERTTTDSVTIAGSAFPSGDIRVLVSLCDQGA